VSLCAREYSRLSDDPACDVDAALLSLREAWDAALVFDLLAFDTRPTFGGNNSRVDTVAVTVAVRRMLNCVVVVVALLEVPHRLEADAEVAKALPQVIDGRVHGCADAGESASGRWGLKNHRGYTTAENKWARETRSGTQEPFEGAMQQSIDPEGGQ
jgi:hypothetical protein